MNGQKNGKNRLVSTGCRRLFCRRLLSGALIGGTLASLLFLGCGCGEIVEPDLLILYSVRSGDAEIKFTDFAGQKWLALVPRSITETDAAGQTVSVQPDGPVLQQLRRLRLTDEAAVSSVPDGWQRKTELVYDSCTFYYYWYEFDMVIQCGDALQRLRMVSQTSSPTASPAS